jgi:hypothetical protein
MTIPDRQVFEEYFRLESAQPAHRLIYHFNPPDRLKAVGAFPPKSLPKPEIPDLDLVERYLYRAATLRQEQLEKLHQASLQQWATKQPGFARALELVKKSLRRRLGELGPNHEKWVTGVLKRLRVETNPTYFFALLASAFDFDFSDSWTGKFFRALFEYHYTTRATDIHRLATCGPPAIEALKKAANDALPFLQQMHDFHLGWGHENLERFLSGARWNFEGLPIRRNSKHKAELLFIVRMYQAHRRHLRTPKPEVIAELMTIEGFRHQLDERTIERQCARLEASSTNIPGDF